MSQLNISDLSFFEIDSFPENSFQCIKGGGIKDAGARGGNELNGKRYAVAYSYDAGVKFDGGIKAFAEIPVATAVAVFGKPIAVVNPTPTV